jgi:phage terminase large subunit-like protein
VTGYDDYRTWTPAAQQKALERLRAAANDTWRPFYCTRRPCDGNPHGDWAWTHARTDQHPPAGDWNTWLSIAGRGAGKTRLGSEYAHRVVEQVPRIIIVAPTSGDLRDVIVEGESGILATARPGTRPDFEPTKRRLTWPNGAQALLISAEEPERLRGPQSYWAWADELATYPKPEDLWSNLVLGLRLGRRPRSLVTTTPKPIPLLKRLIADPRNTITRATTYDNVANLAPSFTEEIVKQYEGTRVGRQELHAEMLADVEGALWTWELIEASRDPGPPEGMQRIVVAVDPAGTSNRRSDETGIVVAGISGDHIYILADRSGKYTPHGWASEAGRLYDAWEADAIVPEVNYGADMVTSTLRSSGIKARITPVVATRGKQVRAEPVVALYEQGRCRLAGSFPKLEQEMAEWVPGEGASPNRVDAMVWAVTALDKRTAKARIGTHRHLRAVV